HRRNGVLRRHPEERTEHVKPELRVSEEEVPSGHVDKEKHRAEQKTFESVQPRKSYPEQSRKEDDCQHVEDLRPTGPLDKVSGEDVVNDRSVNLGTRIHVAERSASQVANPDGRGPHHHDLVLEGSARQLALENVA